MSASSESESQPISSFSKSTDSPKLGVPYASPLPERLVLLSGGMLGLGLGLVLSREGWEQGLVMIGGFRHSEVAVDGNLRGGMKTLNLRHFSRIL